MSPVLTVVISIVVLIVGIAIGYILRKNVGEKAIGSAEQQARNMILDAQNTVENLKKEKVLEAKEEIHKLREEYEGRISFSLMSLPLGRQHEMPTWWLRASGAPRPVPSQHSARTIITL